MNFTQHKKKCKDILDSLNFGEAIYPKDNGFDLLYSFLEMHPNSKEKIGKGVKRFGCIKNKDFGNKQMALINNEDKLITFSLSFAKNKKSNKRNDILSALRTCIHQEIKNKKKSFVSTFTKCEICKKEINKYSELHIDHHNLDFIEIVDAFLEKENISIFDIGIEKIGTYHVLKDTHQIAKFIVFHNNNTTLRFTHANCNIRKS